MKIALLSFLLLVFSCSQTQKKGKVEINNQDKKETKHKHAHSMEEALKTPSKITSIFLDGYEIFPKELLLLKNLESITFHNCSFKSIPSYAKNLENVKRLEFEKAKIIPDGLKWFVNVSSVLLVKCEFENIPDAICELKKLKYLEIIDSFSAKKLNNCICDLTNIETLKLGMLNLDGIDKGISNLKNIKHLSYVYTGIRSVPNFVFSLPKLEKLTLEYNMLSEIQIKRLDQYSEKIEIIFKQESR